MFSKTVDKVLSSITRGISELRAIGEAEAQRCNGKNELAKQLQAEADGHSDEADRAFTLAERFEKLITVTPGEG